MVCLLKNQRNQCQYKKERIDGKTYTFDNKGCTLIFYKLKNVMGEDEEEQTFGTRYTHIFLNPIQAKS